MEPDDKSNLPSFECIRDLQKMSAENQRQIDATNSLINNSAIQAIVDKFDVDNFAKNHPLADDIENGVKELIKENNKLKDMLKCNSVSMKRHFAILEKWLEDAHTSHRNYKKKLEEAKDVNLKLKTENNELRKPMQEAMRSIETRYMTEKNKLLQENQLLRDRVILMQQKLHKLEQTSASTKTEKEQELCQIIVSLNKQLENSERARRKLSMEVDRYHSQEMKLQQILANGDQNNVTNMCFWNALFPGDKTSSPRESQLLANIKQCDEILQSENAEIFPTSSPDHSLESSWAKLSISDVSVEEKSIEELKKDNTTLHRQIVQEHAVLVLQKKILADLHAKFKVIYPQTSQILKEHDSKIKAQQIELVKAQEDAKDITSLRHDLSDKQNRIIQLETDVCSLRKKLEEAEKRNEDFFILQSQVKLYEEDFLTERDARETLANEKQLLQRNLNALQKKNKELMNKLRAFSGDALNNFTGNEASVNNQQQYTCFNETCSKSFASEEELQTHIYSCLNLKD